MTVSERIGSDQAFDGASMHRRLWSERFIGRERAMERIALGLQGIADGRPSTLLLSGTSGTGLTPMLDETSRR